METRMLPNSSHWTTYVFPQGQAGANRSFPALHAEWPVRILMGSRLQCRPVQAKSLLCRAYICTGQMLWHLQRRQRACHSYYIGPLGKSFEGKYLAIWKEARFQNGLFSVWQPAMCRWKGRLITNFHYPQIKKKRRKKQQQAKQVLWGREVWPEIYPGGHKGDSAKQINQSLNHSHFHSALYGNGNQCLSACQVLAFKPSLLTIHYVHRYATYRSGLPVSVLAHLPSAAFCSQ